jgi:hypothetical protein
VRAQPGEHLDHVAEQIISALICINDQDATTMCRQRRQQVFHAEANQPVMTLDHNRGHVTVSE